MKKFLQRISLGLSIHLAFLVSATAQYEADILGASYQSRYLDLERGERAALVRLRPTTTRRRAVLYIHGYNDYFFQTSLAERIDCWGYNFYALDLRRYGRAIRPGDRLFECKDVRVYQEEIGKALDIIKQEGNEEVYLMAHSTGCLIAALYLHDTNNKAEVRGLMLNSPFIDYNSTKLNERLLLPLVTSTAWLMPNAVIIPASKAGQVDLYAKSLLQDHEGLWQFDTNWKRPEGYPIRASWLRAIKRGHRRVQAGLNLQIPILLLSSTRSILPSEGWQEDYAAVDLVLDVKDMWRYGAKLGREVTFIKIPNGIHDLVLSKDPTSRAQTYEAMHRWLERISLQTEGLHQPSKTTN